MISSRSLRSSASFPRMSSNTSIAVFAARLTRMTVFRLSEIYLIAAEAALLQSAANKELAATYLNEIRQRSPQLDPATAATVSLDLIAQERRKELVGEGQRFFNMIR